VLRGVFWQHRTYKYKVSSLSSNIKAFAVELLLPNSPNLGKITKMEGTENEILDHQLNGLPKNGKRTRTIFSFATPLDLTIISISCIAAIIAGGLNPLMTVGSPTIDLGKRTYSHGIGLLRSAGSVIQWFSERNYLRLDAQIRHFQILPVFRVPRFRNVRFRVHHDDRVLFHWRTDH